jgi:hypothetical protein
MNRKLLKESFSHIIEHSEWFNKVLIGGVYVILIPFGIGIIMLNGFLLQTSESILHGEKGLPQWRNFKLLFKTGIRSTLGSVLIGIIVYFFSRSLTLIETIFLIALGVSLNSLMIVMKSNNKFPIHRWEISSQYFFMFLVSYLFVLASICFGWMFIIAGWPLVIFLTILIQVILLTKTLRS